MQLDEQPQSIRENNVYAYVMAMSEQTDQYYKVLRHFVWWLAKYIPLLLYWYNIDRIVMCAWMII